MPSKILLQINVTSNWGSTGHIAEIIGKKAIECGWKSYIAYGRYHNPSLSENIRVGCDLATYFHYAADKILGLEGRASVAATKHFIKQIDLIHPDVVQLHNIHDHFINYPLLFEYLNNSDIKVVWSFHDAWAFTGHCKHFVECNCDKWQSVCVNCPMLAKKVDLSKSNFILKKKLFTANKNLIIVPASEWMAESVRRSFFKNNTIKVIHNGIDLNLFVPSNQRTNDGKFRVIAVSNGWPGYKGLNDIIKLRRFLPPEVVINVVGVSKEQSLSLPPGITGIQLTQNIQELVDMYGNSDVFINTTYADTFPTVNLESLACGTPIITYRTGGSPEILDAKTGIVVDKGDVEAMASAILYLWKHPLSRDNCRQRAVELFDKDKCFRKYVELYDSLIS